MQVDEDIYTALSSDANVTNLASSRLYPVRAPQDPLPPYVVWTRISSVPEDQHDTTTTPGLYRTTYQVSTYAKTFAEVDALLAVVRVALLTAGAVGQAAIQEARRDNYEPATELYRADLDITFWHNA